MKTTKIDWCDCTINPVVGCRNGCPYCYAEKLNKRFGFIPNWREPQFFPERLKALESKTPKTIFMDSMSDVSWWQEEWGSEVFKAMQNNPQHSYIFLTKGGTYPAGIHSIWTLRSIRENISGIRNIFIGHSITNNKQFDCSWHYDFLSIEPILEPIDLKSIEHSLYIKSVIIGAETGNRKGKVIPNKEWITDIVKHCDAAHVRVFMKESLRQIMGDEFRQDTLPWYEHTRRNQNDKRRVR